MKRTLVFSMDADLEEVCYMANENVTVSDVLCAMKSGNIRNAASNLGKRISFIDYAEYFQHNNYLALAFYDDDNTLDVGLSEAKNNHIFKIRLAEHSVEDIIDMINKADE